MAQLKNNVYDVMITTVTRFKFNLRTVVPALLTAWELSVFELPWHGASGFLYLGDSGLHLDQTA
jgi:hypothetical protein